MKCQKCGAEISDKSVTCEYCGSQISYEMKREYEKINKQGCPKCGSSNISFNREKQGEYKGKRGTSVLRKTIGICKDCGYTWDPNMLSKNKKKSSDPKIWLWILGWIVIFPVPLTIILWKQEKLDSKIRYGLIAAAWVLYLVLGFVGGHDEKKSTKESNQYLNESTSTNYGKNKSYDLTETSAPMTSDNYQKEPKDTNKAIEVKLKLMKNVNDETGEVLFGVDSNLPEDTRLIVTITNQKGYKSQDSLTILKDGKGYTSEFSENGKGLSGKYNVTISSGIARKQKQSVRDVIGEYGENIVGKYVRRDDNGKDNIIEGKFNVKL
ncbi:zinc ribbon domain-containing protein [Eubacterium xylanophilum]|uniref:zinc ribbon domain-containing protein n=1 Tax=Eubacterium xylanophilum TaxID=39497 RepID=UPI00047E9E86|nr:zinc ribbon domain-containing protein [Eubacterium xylanophilum]